MVTGAGDGPTANSVCPGPWRTFTHSGTPPLKYPSTLLGRSGALPAIPLALPLFVVLLSEEGELPKVSARMV